MYPESFIAPKYSRYMGTNLQLSDVVHCRHRPSQIILSRIFHPRHRFQRIPDPTLLGWRRGPLRPRRCAPVHDGTALLQAPLADPVGVRRSLCWLINNHSLVGNDILKLQLCIILSPQERTTFFALCGFFSDLTQRNQCRTLRRQILICDP